MTEGPIERYRVVLMRALGGLGDTLCAVPALRLLHYSMPEAHITYLGLDRAAPLAHRFAGYFDSFTPFPGWPGIPERSSVVDVDALKACSGADLIIQMHGDGTTSNQFCASLAPRTLVSYGPAVTVNGCITSTSRFDPTMNEVVRCYELADRAIRVVGGLPAESGLDLEFPLAPGDIAAAKSCRDRLRFSRQPYVVIHPGASSEDRRWPAERFARVARELLWRGVVPVITGGREERHLAWQVSHLIGPGAVVAAGELTLGAMAATLALCAGVITNDTGISHLAAAVGAPSVVIFTGSDPNRWAPLDDRRNQALWRRSEDTEASTGLLEPPSVEEVLSAIASLDITA